MCIWRKYTNKVKVNSKSVRHYMNFGMYTYEYSHHSKNMSKFMCKQPFQTTLFVCAFDFFFMIIVVGFKFRNKWNRIRKFGRSRTCVLCNIWVARFYWNFFLLGWLTFLARRHSMKCIIWYNIWLLEIYLLLLE